MNAHSLSLHHRPRRDSFDVDDRRANVFRPIEHGIFFKEALTETLDEWDDWAKRVGQRHAFGLSGRKVLDALLRCCDFRTGVCEPSIERLMEKTCLARATVVRALKMLFDHGFINWIRRTEKTGLAPDEGPPVRQVSNAYFFDVVRLPERCLKRLKEKLRRKGKAFTPPPAPSFPRYEGLQERRSRTIRDQVAYDRAKKRNALAAARTDEQRVAALYPGDTAAQREHLAMLQGEGASSATGLNPSPRSSIQKE